MLLRDGKVINVGIAEIQISRSPNILRTTLGSCLGVVLYQPDIKLGAIAHIMLARDPVGRDSKQNPMKYAETALPMLLRMFEQEGARTGTYAARIFGGASMFKNIGSNFLQNIGKF
jgi:chemotaxis protein CheD